MGEDVEQHGRQGPTRALTKAMKAVAVMVQGDTVGADSVCRFWPARRAGSEGQLGGPARRADSGRGLGGPNRRDDLSEGRLGPRTRRSVSQGQELRSVTPGVPACGGGVGRGGVAWGESSE